MFHTKKYKLARRLGPGIHEKTMSDKFALREARKKTQTRGGGRRRRMISEYGKQLLEKQKVRFTYGVTERQFRNYVAEATKEGGDSGQNLLDLLESRLDNVVYRIGIAPTRPAARQMVSHGHIQVNTKRTRVPSHRIFKGDDITVREASLGKPVFEIAKEEKKERKAPSWITENKDGLTAKVSNSPTVDPLEAQFDPTVIIEFYSR